LIAQWGSVELVSTDLLSPNIYAFASIGIRSISMYLQVQQFDQMKYELCWIRNHTWCSTVFFVSWRTNQWEFGCTYGGSKWSSSNEAMHQNPSRKL